MYSSQKLLPNLILIKMNLKKNTALDSRAGFKSLGASPSQVFWDASPSQVSSLLGVSPSQNLMVLIVKVDMGK